MTTGHRPVKAHQPTLDCRIGKAERGLMSDRTLIVVPMSDAARCMLRQFGPVHQRTHQSASGSAADRDLSHAPIVTIRTIQRP
jgi:hypothetical protein